MDLDWTTVIFELINFGVLALLLTRFLFKPVRKLLLERKREVASAQAEAEAARAHSEAAQLQFERRQHELQAEAAALRLQATAEGQRAADALIKDGREELRRRRASLELELERARVDALQRLRPELIELTFEAGRRLLLDLHAGELAQAFVSRGARSLQDALATDASGLAHKRVHAFVSPDADLDAVARTLRETLGDAQVELDVDASLVGGVRLIADGVEVEASAGASLRQWLRERLQPGTPGPPPAEAGLGAAP
ncbi:Sodium-transporting ATPase subunit F [Enhygromyxa salina]|uniref:ATP synthase subunit b n=1 Tax=Enhygromyxa salina TaxID=215803 RepID=A0A0C2D554_9BACT|nr:ATP synthase F0 subunit B [Enhygromyxa salina]KIG16825.1 Sodium-transporting ATPase subunit F [Enhygromyxa salina]